MLETDGPYAGNPCASTSHSHVGAADSVDMQWRGQAEFYSLMRAHEVFVHAPDGYLYDGGANKECGGYEENQMSLPRWQWLSIAHQENYDDLWTETPTQAWMFAPLDDYHAGGAGAALEPFAQNAQAWNWTLGTFIGHGRGACYRGDHLFDTVEVQKMVAFWTQFWLKYRAILIQDIIHIRRPDMQSIDSVMHVTANRSASVCALAMYYNPSLFKQSITLKLPLYYTGETDAVLLEWNGAGAMRRMTLARDYSIVVNVTLGPREIGFSVAHRLSSQREKKEAVPISWKSDNEATEPWQSGNACKRSEHGSPTCTGSTGRDLPPHVLCESTVRVICSRGNCSMTALARGDLSCPITNSCELCEGLA